MSINGCKHFQEALDIRTGPLMVHSRGFLCYSISCFIVALIYLDPLGDSKSVIVDEDDGKRSEKKLYSNNKQHDLTNPGRNSASNAPMSEGSRSDQPLVSYGFWLLERKENNKRFKHYQERDEARDQLQKVLNKVMSSSSLEFLIGRPQIQLESPLIKPT